MLAIAARDIGYRAVTLDPQPNCPAAQVSDEHITAAYDDFNAVADLARRAAVITYEFENVDAAALDSVSQSVEVIPSVSVLRITQDRELEKTKMLALGIPVPDFRIVSPQSKLADTVEAVGQAAAELGGGKCVIKTTRWGYDGKGQAVAENPDQARTIRSDPTLFDTQAKVIVEQFVDFTMELSVICARDRSGNMETWAPSHNVHVGGILDTSTVPAQASDPIESAAQHLARRIALGLDVVGLIAVEMFLTRDGSLMVNELAPRVHNSGHHTIEACHTSQFQQLTRIMAALPMGNPALKTPAAAMVNLLGDVWAQAGGEPDWQAAESEIPEANWHIYGKSEPRIGRKMGHITVTADDPTTALDRATRARQSLTQHRR